MSRFVSLIIIKRGEATPLAVLENRKSVVRNGTTDPDYMKIIKEEGILPDWNTDRDNSENDGEKIGDRSVTPESDLPSIFEDRETLKFGIPHVIKYLYKGGNNNTEMYYFYPVVGSRLFIVYVGTVFDEEIRYTHLIPLIRLLEKILITEDNKLSADAEDRAAVAFARIFYGHLIGDFLIPAYPKIELLINGTSFIMDKAKSRNKQEKPKETEIDKNGVDTTLKKKIQKSTEKFFRLFPVKLEKDIIDVQGLTTEKIDYKIVCGDKKEIQPIVTDPEKLIKAIDGITSIGLISDTLRINRDILSCLLLFLKLNGLIIFRIPLYGWYIFRRTHRANVFLYDGSDAQNLMIQKYGGGKIVSILGRIDGYSTVKEILQESNIPRVKLYKTLYDLWEEKLIEPVFPRPRLKHIPEERIPLLVIQGISEEDIGLLEKLEKLLDGKLTVIDAALIVGKPPDKIKNILDKVKEFIID